MEAARGKEKAVKVVQTKGNLVIVINLLIPRKKQRKSL